MSVVLLIEPETPEGKALSARLQGGLELLDADIAAVSAKRLERAWPSAPLPAPRTLPPIRPISTNCGHS